MDQSSGGDEKSRKMRGQNLVPFLAHLEKVRPEIEAGWPIKAVYQRYEATLDMSYIQFTRYVNRYIKQNATAPKAKAPTLEQVTPPSKGTPPISVTPTQTESPSSSGKPGFKQFVPGPKDPDPKELW